MSNFINFNWKFNSPKTVTNSLSQIEFPWNSLARNLGDLRIFKVFSQVFQLFNQSINTVQFCPFDKMIRETRLHTITWDQHIIRLKSIYFLMCTNWVVLRKIITPETYKRKIFHNIESLISQMEWYFSSWHLVCDIFLFF